VNSPPSNRTICRYRQPQKHFTTQAPPSGSGTRRSGLPRCSIESCFLSFRSWSYCYRYLASCIAFTDGCMFAAYTDCMTGARFDDPAALARPRWWGDRIAPGAPGGRGPVRVKPGPRSAVSTGPLSPCQRKSTAHCETSLSCRYCCKKILGLRTSNIDSRSGG